MPDPIILDLEEVHANHPVAYLSINMLRTKVPGGWLVMVAQLPRAMCFVPDPNHTWQASTATPAEDLPDESE